MGNSFSGVSKKLDELDEDRLTLEQKHYLSKLSAHLKDQSLQSMVEILNYKAPGYFEQPTPRSKIILPPLPEKELPDVSLDQANPSSKPPPAPPAPSFAHLHPAADLLRRHLFLHVFSDQFSAANIPSSKLFVPGPTGDGEGELKIAYIHIINGIYQDSKLLPCPLSCDERTELQSLLPSLHKLRLLVKTSRTTSKSLGEHSNNQVPGPVLNTTHEYVRITEIRVEITGFDSRNRVVETPGVVGIGARMFVEQVREMGHLVERKGWGWCVEQAQELCKAVIGEDGGVWDFVKGGWEEAVVEVEGEGLVNCFVARAEGT